LTNKRHVNDSANLLNPIHFSKFSAGFIL
jgi:hypothetical protein